MDAKARLDKIIDRGHAYASEFCWLVDVAEAALALFAPWTEMERQEQMEKLRATLEGRP